MDDDQLYFVYEGCTWFAVAFHELYGERQGGHFGLLFDLDYWDDDGNPIQNFVHCVYFVEHHMLDARGWTNTEEVMDDFGVTNEHWAFFRTPEEVVDILRGFGCATLEEAKEEIQMAKKYLLGSMVEPFRQLRDGT